MKAKEIREKGQAEWAKLEGKLREDLAAARLQLRAGQLANTAKIKAIRRDLARVLTLRHAAEGQGS
jgi:large subunit ribosomal protein L29